jgi:hypothetical protein
LRRRPERAFRRCAEIDARAVEVQMVGSTGVLRGMVKPSNEREEAKRAASPVPGVVYPDETPGVEEEGARIPTG